MVRYLQGNGWPGAERRALRGTKDAGDITGTPGVAWEVKSRGRAVSDRQIEEWLAETEAERVNARADVGVLVVRRAGFGPANAGSWWAITWATVWAPADVGHLVPVRTLLSDTCRMLRRTGYGDPLTEVTDP